MMGVAAAADCRSHQFATDEVFAQPHPREMIEADRTVIHSIDAKLMAAEELTVDQQSTADRLTNPMAKDYRDEVPLGKSRSFSRSAETVDELVELAPTRSLS